jgi:spore coat polysaccharide biosynthesis predicted glycosyltransferase SpsG
VFAICLESSHARGMGHLFRMRNLALLLRARQIPFVLLINEHPPALELLRREGLPFEVMDLTRVAHWAPDAIRRHRVRTWVNDRLDTELIDARAIKDAGIPLVTFDDRGPGASLADLHIAALAVDPGERLAATRVVRGLDYLILNPEIARWRRQRTEPRRIMITLGGSDTYGVTVKAVALLRRHARNASVIIGPGFQHRAALDAELTAGFELKIGLPSLIEEMNRHDLAITGGGITAFEAAASGLPVIAIANEWFEVPVAQHLAKLGAARYAGHHSRLDENAFAIPHDLTAMSSAGLAQVPLHGAERVCQLLLELT